MPDNALTVNEVLARSGLAGAISGVILLLVALGGVVDVASGRRYFKEDLARYAINYLGGKGISVESVRSEKSRNMLNGIIIATGSFSGEAQVKGSYVEVLKFVERSLGIEMPERWEEVRNRRLNDRKCNIKRTIESHLKDVTQWSDEKKYEIIKCARDLSKVSFIGWYLSGKECSADWLGRWYKIKVASGLAGNFLGLAGTGGTLGLFVGLVVRLFNTPTGDVRGLQVSVLPVVGTIIGGYIGGLRILLVKYRGTSLSKQPMVYLGYFLAAVCSWLLLSIVFAGGFARYRDMVATILPWSF